MDTFSECAQVGVRVTRRGVEKTRAIVKVVSEFGGCDIGVHNNTLKNGLRGLLERVLKYRGPDGRLHDLPEPKPAALDLLEAFSRRYQREARCATPLTDQEFLAGYEGRRRAIYEDAVASLLSSPVTPRDAAVGPSFVKAEKINFEAKGDPAPRVIQPRSPRYNVEVGKYLRRIEHDVYQNIARVYGGPTVMKGFTPFGTGCQLKAMWDEFLQPVAVGLDASRFDQHVRPGVLRWEHSVYLKHFGGGCRRKLKRLLSWQVRNKGTMRCSDGVAKYEVDGARMSGDMNTALGNCLIMCAIVWCLLAKLGIKARLANNGDDCMVIMEGRDLARFTAAVDEFFLDFGFRVKTEPAVRIFEHIEFCQAHPVKVEGGYLMVRNVDIAIAKDLCATNPAYGHGKGFRKWVGAVGQCGLAIAGGVPIYQEFYAMLARSGLQSAVSNDVGLQGSGFFRMAKGMQRGYAEVPEDTRVSFWEAFGIPPSQQEALEHRLREVELLVPDAPGKLLIPDCAITGYRLI